MCSDPLRKLIVYLENPQGSSCIEGALQKGMSSWLRSFRLFSRHNDSLTERSLRLSITPMESLGLHLGSYSPQMQPAGYKQVLQGKEMTSCVWCQTLRAKVRSALPSQTPVRNLCTLAQGWGRGESLIYSRTRKAAIALRVCSKRE